MMARGGKCGWLCEEVARVCAKRKVRGKSCGCLPFSKVEVALSAPALPRAEDASSVPRVETLPNAAKNQECITSSRIFVNAKSPDPGTRATTMLMGSVASAIISRAVTSHSNASSPGA